MTSSVSRMRGLSLHDTLKQRGQVQNSLLSCQIVERPAALKRLNSQHYSPILADRPPGPFPRMLQEAVWWYIVVKTTTCPNVRPADSSSSNSAILITRFPQLVDLPNPDLHKHCARGPAADRLEAVRSPQREIIWDPTLRTKWPLKEQ
jgi:hypothetical protein